MEQVIGFILWFCTIAIRIFCLFELTLLIMAFFFKKEIPYIGISAFFMVEVLGIFVASGMSYLIELILGVTHMITAVMFVVGVILLALMVYLFFRSERLKK